MQPGNFVNLSIRDAVLNNPSTPDDVLHEYLYETIFDSEQALCGFVGALFESSGRAHTNPSISENEASEFYEFICGFLEEIDKSREDQLSACAEKFSTLEDTFCAKWRLLQSRCLQC